MSGDRVVFVDVETGGLDPSRNPIVQFAAVVVDGAWDEIEALEVKLHFDLAACDPGALEANRYDPETWKREGVSGPLARQRVADLFRRHSAMEKVSRAGKPYTVARLAAHNAPFDCGFIAAWFKQGNLFCPAACFEPLDTLALARWASLGAPDGPADHKLGSLCAWLGVPLDKAHDALSDVRATVAVARVLAERLGIRWAP